MKKVILALVALAFAFAISSCCDQGYCPGNRRCEERTMQRGGRSDDVPYRFDNNEARPQPGQERQHRRW